MVFSRIYNKTVLGGSRLGFRNLASRSSLRIRGELLRKTGPGVRCSTWTPTLCKAIACWAMFDGFGRLLYFWGPGNQALVCKHLHPKEAFSPKRSSFRTILQTYYTPSPTANVAGLCKNPDWYVLQSLNQPEPNVVPNMKPYIEFMSALRTSGFWLVQVYMPHDRHDLHFPMDLASLTRAPMKGT